MAGELDEVQAFFKPPKKSKKVSLPQTYRKRPPKSIHPIYLINLAVLMPTPNSNNKYV